MGYVDLIPNVFRLTASIANNKTYRTQKFNVGNKQCIGVTVKASQALSIAVAYGIATDTAASAGVDQSPSLPYKTSATTFASNNSTEGGTYHELAIPPHARQAQLVISNASGSDVASAVFDAALRVVAYPASGSGGGGDFASITGWPGSSSQVVRADGSYSALSAAEITSDLGTSTGTANALAVAPAGDATTTFEANRLYWVKSNLANTGATTLAKNGGTAVSIRKNPNSAALVGGEIPANQLILLRYDGTYLQFVAGRALLDSEASSLCTPVTTGGTNTAYTLADTRIGTPVDGQIFAMRVHLASGTSPTLAVNGGSALQLRRRLAANSLGAFVVNQLQPLEVFIVKYDATNTCYTVISDFPLQSGDIPTSLGGTEINTIDIAKTTTGTIMRASSTASLSLRGGSASNEPLLQLTAQGATNNPGAVTLMCKMLPKAASTSYNLWPITTNFYGSVWLIDDTQAGNAITEVVINAGVISAINGDTTCYKTGSATGDQMQLTISGGFLVGTTGNTYARYLGINANRMGHK